MTDSELKEYLLRQASAKNICDPGYEKMLACDIDGLVDYYIAHPDWCLERNYPTLAFLKQNFSNIEDKGVFIGRTFHGELLKERQTYIFHGCKGTIKVGLNVEMAIIPMLYLANGCRLRIIGVGDIKPKKAKDRSIVPIYTFGKNDVSTRKNKYVEFTHYKSDLIL